MAQQKIKPLPFYANWSGHPIEDLPKVLSAVKSERPSKPIIWFAGDSSLDNKAWVISAGPGGEPLPAEVPSIYNSFLDPSTPKPDVAFWLNHCLLDKATAINTAVEATLLRQRDENLLEHDIFIRDHIVAEDILIVSVGANDIALSPNTATMRHMAQLAWLTPLSSIEKGTASSLRYFKTIFKDKTQTYIERLVSRQRPRAILICAIYYPFEGSQSGWAEKQLSLLGYNRNPRQLQAAIRKIYEQATAEIEIEGTRIVPVALFEVMDGKNEEDYVERAEPSVVGGRKMAKLFAEKIDGFL